MNREPAVAGQFYPSSPAKLSEQVKAFTSNDVDKEDVLGIVSPHAGLMYSGRVAGSVYSRIKFPGTFVLVGPNHTGLGSPVSIMSSGVWRMPTGELEVDTGLAEKIKAGSDIFSDDSLAHRMEHSLEVQLPFILYYSSDIKIVPITIMSDSLDDCRITGETIARVIRETDYPVSIIASSDMSHYVSDSVAREKDGKAISKIEAIDPEGLYRTVKDEGITMCGVIPVTSMLYAARELGSNEAVLVKYMTSGEVSGDYEYVVGYAGMIIK